MRRSSSVTSVSWIPSEAIPGPVKIPFSLGVGHIMRSHPASLVTWALGATPTGSA